MMRMEMTPPEREISIALAKSLALREKTELIVNLDATTLVGGKSMSGAGLWIVPAAGRGPLHMFVPWNLFASALTTAIAGWGPEFLQKLKPYQEET